MKSPRLNSSNHKNQKLREEWVHVYGDESSKEVSNAVQFLRDVGFLVISVPVEGKSEPEMALGYQVFYGFNEIKQVVAKY